MRRTPPRGALFVQSSGVTGRSLTGFALLGSCAGGASAGGGDFVATTLGAASPLAAVEAAGARAGAAGAAFAAGGVTATVVVDGAPAESAVPPGAGGSAGWAAFAGATILRLASDGLGFCPHRTKSRARRREENDVRLRRVVAAGQLFAGRRLRFRTSGGKTERLARRRREIDRSRRARRRTPPIRLVSIPIARSGVAPARRSGAKLL